MVPLLPGRRISASRARECLLDAVFCGEVLGTNLDSIQGPATELIYGKAFLIRGNSDTRCCMEPSKFVAVVFFPRGSHDYWSMR